MGKGEDKEPAGPVPKKGRPWHEVLGRTGLSARVPDKIEQGWGVAGCEMVTNKKNTFTQTTDLLTMEPKTIRLSVIFHSLPN